MGLKPLTSLISLARGGHAPYWGLGHPWEDMVGGWHGHGAWVEKKGGARGQWPSPNMHPGVPALGYNPFWPEPLR